MVRIRFLLPLIAAFGMFFASRELFAGKLAFERAKLGPNSGYQEDRVLIAEVFAIGAGAPSAAFCLVVALIPGDHFVIIVILFSLCLVAQWYFIGLLIEARYGLARHPFDPPSTPRKLVLLITLRFAFAVLIVLAPLAILSMQLEGLVASFFYAVWGAIGTSMGFLWSDRLKGKAVLNEEASHGAGRETGVREL